MNFVQWSMQGTLLTNCNCDFGCPCQFNANPTHGDCRAYGFTQIDRGLFGDVPLDGLRWGILLSWPGPIHMGNGTAQSVVDARADERQRAALEAVSQGRETEPGTLIWQIFSTTVTQVLPTLVKNIELSVDYDAAKGSVRVPGVLEGSVAPIGNPMTGQPHRARVTLPRGFEYTEAEYASGSGRTEAGAGIALDLNGTHAHLARVHWSTQGVVR